MKIVWRLYYYDELTKFIVYHVSPNSMFYQRVSGNKIDRTKRIKLNLITYVLTSVKISPYFGVLIREGELVVDPKKLVRQIRGGKEDWKQRLAKLLLRTS